MGCCPKNRVLVVSSHNYFATLLDQFQTARGVWSITNDVPQAEDAINGLTVKKLIDGLQRFQIGMDVRDNGDCPDI